MGNLENLTKFITPAVLGLTVAAFTTFRGEQYAKKAGNNKVTAFVTRLGVSPSFLSGCLAGLAFGGYAGIAREVLINSPAILQNEGMKSALIVGVGAALTCTKKLSFTEGLAILAASYAAGLAVEQYMAR